MIIKTAEQLRNLTGSYYANNDFTKIEVIVRAVEDDLTRIIGERLVAELAEEADSEETAITLETDSGQTLRVANREFTIEGTALVLADGYSAYGISVRQEGDTLFVSNRRAVVALQQAIAYMATMRFYRLNDLSHEGSGRKAKIDKENEGRPFEWQLARDDRAHMDEYYRALDRLADALQGDPRYWLTEACRRQQSLIVADADSLAYLTGVEPSPWLYWRMVPFLSESQRYVAKAFGSSFSDTMASPEPMAEDMQHAAQMATALGALALMGRRTSLQALPYGLFKQMEQDGGGNRREQPSLERLDHYLKHLSKEQHYWLNEMRTLRDVLSGAEPVTHLQMPDNDRHNKYMRL